MALVYPNSDPGMFWVAFFGCLLAEVIPVPIEVPLSRKVRKPPLEHRWGLDFLYVLFTANEIVLM